MIAQNNHLVKEVLLHFTEHLLDIQSGFSAQKSDFRLGKEEKNLETSQKSRERAHTQFLTLSHMSLITLNLKSIYIIPSHSI